MLRPVFPLVTDRLRLRGFSLRDLDQVYAYQRLPEVAQYMLWPPRSKDETRAVVKQMAVETKLEREGDCLTLAVTYDGALIGQVELVWLSKEHQQGEIGYMFAPAYHGKGFATEAAHEILRLGFDGLGLHRIIGRCNADNAASANLMRRLGMQQEAHFRHNAKIKGEWRDQLVFAVTRPPR